MKWMSKLIISGLFLFGLWVNSANAEEIEPKMLAALEEMSELTNMEAIMEGVWAQVNSIQAQMLQQSDIPADKQEQAKVYGEKIMVLFKEEMSWSKLKQPLFDIYAKVYSLEEIQAINSFYKSPVGKKMVAKSPELMQETMVVMQKFMSNIMPKVQAIAEEMKSEIRAQ